MNITAAEAAAQARVTVATIRTWCARGVITATKQAGRWVIETASLAYRINLPTLLRPARKAVRLTAEMIVALGGRRWQKNGMDRVYLNDWHEYAGLDVAYYRTGNVSGATLGGRGIANGRVPAVIAAVGKVWFDTADNELHISGRNAEAVEVRYLDGDREYVDLATRIRHSIRTAVAAL